MKIIAFLLALFSVVAEARQRFSISPSTLRYLQNAEGSHHRSGLEEKERAEFEDQDQPILSRNHGHQKGKIEGIVVSDSIPDPDFMKMLDRLQQEGLKFAIGPTPALATSSDSLSIGGEGLINPSRPEESNREILKQLLPPQMRRKLSLWNVGKEYKEIDGGKPELISYRFRFVRVEKRRILRDSRSFFEVKILPEGKVVGVKLQWPLISSYSITKRKLLSEESVLTGLQTELDSNFTEFQKRDSEQKRSAQEHRVRGAAKAWCKDEYGNGSELIPCFSFRVDAKLSEQDSAAVIVDQPAIARE
ncbi:MAG: hypothetical protein IPN71_12680 [Fibrobacteres bacterium]|nr:hypothetical protein [Fibrobacterota bacterium]